MNVIVRKSFEKDMQDLDDKTILIEIFELVASMETALNLQNFPNIKKLKGFRTAYRIRLGQYRVGFTWEDDTVEFVRVLHRKHIYRFFP